MEEKKNNKAIWIAGVIILVIVLIIFLPGLFENKKALDTAKLEGELIKEGKTKSPSEVIEEIAEILKNKDKEGLKEYLADDFVYLDNDRNESKYASSFLEDLGFYATSHDTERRGNDIKDKETYRLYWNTVEQNIKNGIKRGERGYCLQTITIMMKKVVRQDIVTYEIEKIILTDA